MKQRVLLLSSVHPATDPRILYKIVPSLAPFYEVFCALPVARQDIVPDRATMIRLPMYRNLLYRIIFTHPVLLWKCLRLNPALVHIFVPELIPVAFLFQLFGAKVVYEVQEDHYQKFQFKKYNNGTVFRALFVFFDHFARRRFHCLFTEEAYLAEYGELGHPCEVVHNYAPLKWIDSCLKINQENTSIPEFFYSGVISTDRCFDVLVDALGIFKQKYPAFLVHLFGPVRVSSEETNQLPHFENVRQNLIFYGYTDLRIAIPFAQRALAGIALLKPIGDYPDSYPTKLFDYMALRLPVITSDFTLYRSIVERSGCGFCIAPSDAALLAEKLEWFVLNPGGAREMGLKGRNSVESCYNWENEEKILLSFYKSIVPSIELKN